MAQQQLLGARKIVIVNLLTI